jgi:hypothetical protein
VYLQPKPLFWLRFDTDTKAQIGQYFWADTKTRFQGENPVTKGPIKPNLLPKICYKNLYHPKKWEKKISFGKKSFSSDTDTKIGPWFQFTILKPGLGCTL